MAVAGVAGALVGHGVREARRYRMGSYHLPVLPAGSRPIRILQVSDLHLDPNNRELIGFMEALGGQSYDLVFSTGDMLGEPESLEECLRLLSGLKATTGKYFVNGSSDYFAPKLKNYVDYFTGKKEHGTRPNPTRQFRDGLTGEGWTDLTNREEFVDLGGLRIQLTGLDDPYLKRDDRSLLQRSSDANLAICVVHDPAPYLDAMNAGYDLTVAGHTHGGQVRLPFVGALVSNSELPPHLAKGPSRLNGNWLFVTPGLGVAKFAPFRFMCPPEASLLTLTSAQSQVGAGKADAS